jgi:Bax protein
METPAKTPENPAETTSGPLAATPQVFTPLTHRDLAEYFAAHGYGWNTLDKGVPSFILGALPEDIDRVPTLNKKKELFLLSLLPMVLMVNDEILQQRQELLAILDRHDSGSPLSDRQRERLDEISGAYRLTADPRADATARERLLKRVDVIPPSMVLAQAANESGWGSSRFARHGNNLFGEYTFRPGTGMIPERRPAGACYEVRRFPSLYESVRSYMKNINTHWAYQPLRQQRALRRADGLPLHGVDLAQGLKPYSTRGEAYVEDIRTIIRQNRLSLLTAASLRRS